MTLLLAIATFILAIISTASIVVTVRLRAKDLSENRRTRAQNRELEIKVMALNDMKSLAFEFQQLVFLAGTGKGYEKRQFGTRYTNMLSEKSAMLKYTALFSEQLKKKAESLSDCIGDFHKELVSRNIKEDELMFVLDTKERVEIRDRVIKTVDELLDAITKEKIELYIS